MQRMQSLYGLQLDIHSENEFVVLLVDDLESLCNESETQKREKKYSNFC